MTRHRSSAKAIRAMFLGIAVLLMIFAVESTNSTASAAPIVGAVTTGAYSVGQGSRPQRRRRRARRTRRSRPSTRTVLMADIDRLQPPPRIAVSSRPTVVGTETPPSTGEDPPPPPIVRAPPKTISGGVLNGRAISLPRPAYPPAARAAHASGAVTVQVTVDEEGNVISAAAVSGPPLLHNAAVAAARGAKFTPTKLSGVPVKVTGILLYNFTLD